MNTLRRIIGAIACGIIIFSFCILSGCGSETCDPEGITLDSPINDTTGLAEIEGMLIPIPYGVQGKNYSEDGHGGVDLGSKQATVVIAPIAGTIKQVVVVDLGSSVLIDVGTGNCSVRLTHVSDVAVTEGQSVKLGDTIGKFTQNQGNVFVLHYELSGITEIKSDSDSNASGSLCPFLHSTDSVKATFRTLLTDAANTAVKSSWAARDETVLPTLGKSSNPIGFCYPKGTSSDVLPTFP